jgi:serine phosphatase RsbU (regulator of sigma subunit)
VCGDWYDLVGLPDGSLAVAVRDVVGHGLVAACAMGQLRSALGAACRVADGPAETLDALGPYARSVEGAESTTVARAFVDWDDRTIIYNCAGHPRPRCSAPKAPWSSSTGPPPPARRPPRARPAAQAGAAFVDGSVLVLYTDGLFEHRDEDIDVGLARLADSLTRHRDLDPEALADVLLADLLPPHGNTDDTALIVIRL